MLNTVANPGTRSLAPAASPGLQVLITHADLQHADQLAWALYESGDLSAIWSGVPLVDPDGTRPILYRLLPKLKSTLVPSTMRRHYPLFPAVRRYGNRVLSGQTAKAFWHAVDHAFDRYVARNVAALAPRMVIAYENSALYTFAAAKQIGAVCVLDAASAHYRAKATLFGPEFDPDPAWVNDRKQREIDLADAILTCSPFAADTYADNGVPRDKLYSCVLGTDLPILREPRARGAGPIKFIFIGTLQRLKAVDLLLDIFEELDDRGIPATLTLVGGVGERDLAQRAREIRSVSAIPFVPKPELFEVIAGHDCLLLPSRFDGFGMVVPEAMAVGVPALVSDRVGAKIIIEEHPDAGWIVPFGAETLRAKILELCRDREPLRRAGKAALTAARDYTWASYRQNVVRTLHSIRDKMAGAP